MKTNLLLAVVVLMSGACISAKAADPAPKKPPTAIFSAVEVTKPSATTTPYQFPGKLVRAQMTGGARNEFFVLENATLTPLNPMNGSEWFLVGTGIKNGPRQTSWCEGLEVHLNLHLVASYCPLTPEQWKEQQRSTPRFGPGQTVPSQPATGTIPQVVPKLPLVPIQPTTGTDSTPLDGMIPLPPQPLERQHIVPDQSAVTPPSSTTLHEGMIPSLPLTPPTGPIPSTPGPEAGPPLVFPNPQVVPNPLLPIPQVVQNLALPSQPAAVPPSASGIDAQLKTAQDERVKVLTQLVEALTSQGKLGIVNADQVFSAETDLCNALLDSSDEPEKRVALLTKQLDKANGLLEMIQGQVKAGIVGEADGLRAKSLYLNAKIKLLREGSSKRPLTTTPTAKRP